MNPYLLISIICSVVSILILFHKDWLPGIRPRWYYKFIIFDDSIFYGKTYYIFKPLSGDKIDYDINKKKYSREGVKPKITDGVDTWYFKENCSIALDFVKLEQEINSAIAKQIEDESVDALWDDGKNIKDIVTMVLLGAILLGIVVLFAQQDYNNKAVVELIWNVSRQ